MDAPACKPNISFAGRKRRRQIGQIGIALAAAVFIGLIAVHAPWYWRAAVALPVLGATISLLQVRRNTCVARAREGVFEGEDFSRTPMPPEDVAASRRVASTIMRDSTLCAAVVGIVAAASAWVI